jgi:hypothetical protein
LYGKIVVQGSPVVTREKKRGHGTCKLGWQRSEGAKAMSDGDDLSSLCVDDELMSDED